MKLITTNPESNETIKIYDRYIDILAEFQSLQITLTMWLSELGKVVKWYSKSFLIRRVHWLQLFLW